METLEVLRYWLVGFFMWFIVLIIVNYIKEVRGIINNGNILTDGRCFKTVDKISLKHYHLRFYSNNIF